MNDVVAAGKHTIILQGQIMEIGMQSMIADVDRSRIKLQNKYLQSESTAEELFSEANSVRKKVLDLASHPQQKFALEAEGGTNLRVNGTIAEDSLSSTEDITVVRAAGFNPMSDLGLLYFT